MTSNDKNVSSRYNKDIIKINSNECDIYNSVEAGNKLGYIYIY
jgi:hypothetical protein